MRKSRTRMLAVLATAVAITACIPAPEALAQSTDSSQSIAKVIGAIKAINGNAVRLAPASGPEVVATIQTGARILRMAPGDKDLKNATPIQVQDLNVGDTVRVRGRESAGGIDALEVLVITSSAMDAVRDQIRQDWQKRGVGGLVESVDAASGTVTLSIPGLMNKRTFVVRTTKSTLMHRYAADSAKPEDAKKCTLQDIQVGDQLRARGGRDPDGTEITAEEIYTGGFPQLVGTIKSVDASSGSLSIQDLVTKKTVQLKVNADSQLHKIPAETAQRFAAALRFLKSGAGPGAAGASPSSPSGGVPNVSPSASPKPPVGGMVATGEPAAGLGGRRTGGSGMAHFQRDLDQAPAVTLADLHKGDAVAILATQGTPAGGSTVVKLFSGVEPILEAAPGASQAMMLTPWSLGGAPAGEGAQ